jgi:hypothetical protein
MTKKRVKSNVELSMGFDRAILGGGFAGGVEDFHVPLAGG